MNTGRMIRILVLLVSLQSSVLMAQDYELETVAEGFNYPWCVAFLPEGQFLMSMRSGELRIVEADGKIGEPISGVPSAYVESQGGFFDVVLDPQFESNQLLYLAYAEGTIKENATTVVQAKLVNSALQDLRSIFRVSRNKRGPAHYGGKLVFLSDETLLLTTGDGFDYREAAQDPFSQLGKIVRMNRDGSVPADNPFADGKNGDPLVWSYGHRSPQGLDYDAATGTVYMHEHGPLGGDEVNIVQAGANYGWPAITYGINYSGAYVSPFTEAEGMQQPIHYWVPSIAPSGLAYYNSGAFPGWKNSLFVGALVDKEVRRLSLKDGQIVAQEALFSELDARIRDIRVGPDGLLYILTDSDSGKLVRVRPK